MICYSFLLHHDHLTGNASEEVWWVGLVSTCLGATTLLRYAEGGRGWLTLILSPDGKSWSAEPCVSHDIL